MTTAAHVTTPFTATSTAADVVAGLDLTGRRAIVTGGASGIGIETARALATAGAQVTLAVRDVSAGLRAADVLSTSTRNDHVSVARVDLTDQRSVETFVRNWDGPLHMLVLNAGVMATPELRTAEGWELQFATNHLGHFALATGLHLPLAAAEGARVVAVSSAGHHRAGVDFDDIHFVTRRYDPWTAYGQSKSATILFAVEAAVRWADHGIAVNVANPGRIRTHLQRHITDVDLERLRSAMGALQWKTAAQGAATSTLLAASPVVDGVTGRYFEDAAESDHVAAHARDPEAAARLWTVSARTLA